MKCFKLCEDQLLSRYPVQTIVCDKGREFAAHQEKAEALNAVTYVSLEREINENYGIL